jgi:hypothetical protein
MAKKKDAKPVEKKLEVDTSHLSEPVVLEEKALVMTECPKPLNCDFPNCDCEKQVVEAVQEEEKQIPVEAKEGTLAERRAKRQAEKQKLLN